MKNKKLLKNYFLLVLSILVVIFLCFYIGRWYKVYNEYQLQTPVIRGSLNYEITPLDFDHYLMENPTSTFYLCTSDNMNCRTYEKNFKKLINKKNLQDKIIYVNLTGSDIDSFVNSFNNNYKYKVSLKNDLPAFVSFNDLKVTGILQSNDSELSIKETENFIKLNYISE